MFDLRVIVLASAAVLMSAGATRAENWSDNGPVFESDRRAQEEQAAAERAANRKNYEPVVYPKYMEGGERPDIKPTVPPIVYFDRAEEPGSIIVDTQAKKLYYILPGKKAYAYPISVGRDGFTWTGTERISRIAEWPSWTPPPEMRERVPGLPVTVSGGMKNPQGARALYLGNTVYRIHGTNNDRTVGRANSSGCFRLMNEHVVHLASIAKVGTKVQVMSAYAGGVSENAPFSSIFGFANAEPAAKPEAPAKPKKPAAMTTKKPVAPATATAQVGQPVTPAAGTVQVGQPVTPAAPITAAPVAAPAPVAAAVTAPEPQPEPASSAATPADAAASAAAEAVAAAREARAAATEAAAAARAATSPVAAQAQ